MGGQHALRMNSQRATWACDICSFMFSGSRGISQSSSSLTVTWAPLGRAGVALVTCAGNQLWTSCS